MHTIRHFSKSVALLATLFVMTALPVQGEDAPASPREKELIAVLRSDAPAAEKAITCKLLAIHGSDEAVPELAKLLPNEQLSSWARIALEAIPGEVADEALRNATATLKGKLLIGTINSIGVKRDAKAVELLSSQLQAKDAQVASAAAVALGKIGNDSATKSLQAALVTAPDNVRSAVAEGYVLCAERLHLEGKSAQAVTIYDEIRKADLPKQRVIEATRGAILARNQDGLPLLLEQFRSEDKKFFQLALTTAREFPGEELDKALVAELTKATPQRAALIIYAMADREETVILSAVLDASQQGPREVRLSALAALGRIGNVSCLSPLLKLATEDDDELAQAAMNALADISDETIDSEIVSSLSKTDAKSYPLLIQLVGRRRIEAVPDLLKALENSDDSIRAAALVALGETITLDQLSVLVAQFIKPKHPEDLPLAQQALKAASVRMPDREACAAKLTVALGEAPSEKKSAVLEILSEVGGSNSLKTLGEAAMSNDPQLQDTASRLLGKWNGVDAAPVLLALAKDAPAEKYQVRALRGYIGLARKFTMPEKQRVQMCQTAFDVSRRPEEQKLVLSVLTLHPSWGGLKLSIKAIQIPHLKKEATQSALAIAKKLKRKGAPVEKLLSPAGLEL